MKAFDYVIDSFKRGMVQLVRRPMYFLTMVIIPLFGCWMLLDLLDAGAIKNVPVGIIDLDNSELSRRLSRNLDAFQQVSIKHQYSSFNEAKHAVQSGDILGFYYIPKGLQEEALSGRPPPTQSRRSLSNL